MGKVIDIKTHPKYHYKDYSNCLTVEKLRRALEEMKFTPIIKTPIVEQSWWEEVFSKELERIKEQTKKEFEWMTTHSYPFFPDDGAA